ncbi:glycosyltransferase family 2 protein [Flavobacterium sp. Fl-77]|uniref:Glycosyltransferase family 2 protein n=1 Tax=Flavobacterium flavipigmentatum TaxID=2893884 RepID=A0AAJ2SGX5_9FLAO|nr:MULTISPECIES: glycosyltransferase family 2 protein [unclassified Flavobacterium]MDX6182229.1 glycosyltransferase family 2 protein [Flavobacterium sp. Fl-33]MDX6185858.1 glycosyltransferase family 2 protein [Flavobacterium sp. Fl-77]UFH39037.1 glycosyltransferase [Flavobacterium sp. F-70]
MNQVTPLISVIVPNYNHEKFLIQRLDSIFSQNYPNFEVILIDDCSSDNSRAIILEYAKRREVVHCIMNEVNSGNTFVQWNKGINLASGEYIWIAESDDFCTSDFLYRLIQPLLKDQNVVLSYCQSNRVDERGEVYGNWIEYTKRFDTSLFNKDFILSGNDFIKRFLVYRNVIPNASAVLFRKSRVMEIGPLDEDPYLKCNGDWLFYTKLILNKKIAFLSDSKNNFRFHSQSVIARSTKTQKRLVTIEILIAMRKTMINYFLKQNSHEIALIELNKKQIRVLRYEKALFLIRNKDQIKGCLILLSVFDLFIKEYKFYKNLKLKVKTLI